jgi:hypothetical protein
LRSVIEVNLGKIKDHILCQAIFAARPSGGYRADQDLLQLYFEVLNRIVTTCFSDNQGHFREMLTAAAGQYEMRTGCVHPFRDAEILNVHFAGAGPASCLRRTGVTQSPGPSQNVNILFVLTVFRLTVNTLDL